jgi:hypothetical protein
LKNLIFTAFLLGPISASAKASDVSFKFEGKSHVHLEFLGNDLCKVRKELTEYLSSELSCTHLKIDYHLIRGRFFKKHTFVLEGAAKCPKIEEVNLNIEIADCEECNTTATLRTQDSSGQVLSKKFTVSQAQYLCN